MNRPVSLDRTLFDSQWLFRSEQQVQKPAFGVWAMAVGLGVILAAALILQSMDGQWVEQFNQAAVHG